MHKRIGWMAVAVILAASIPVMAHAQWTWTPQTGRFVNLKKQPRETPELQVEFARSLMLKGDYKRALHETTKFSTYFSDSPLADQNQFLRGEIKLAQGKLVEAAKEYQQVVSRYPSTSLYNDVIKKQYEIGDKLYEKGQANLHKKWRLFRKKPLKSAIEVYAMVIDNQPFTDAAAEAQYKVGLCHYVRKEYVEAAFEYRRVIEDYSTSEWVDDACFGLAQCYCDASRPSEYDQKPGQLAVNAIDDFKQRFPNDSRAASLDERRKEMRERIAGQRLATAKFYAKRRNFPSARVYYEIVAKDFSETSAAGKAQDWLSKNPVGEVSASERALQGKQKAS